MSAQPTASGKSRSVRAVVSRPALKLQSDERLVELTRAGCDPAFEAIVERYRSPLVRYCRSLLGPDRAEDVVQQSLVNALAGLRKDDRSVHLKPWLYQIAHNLSVNALRESGWDHAVLDEDFDGVPQPPDVLDQRERLRRLLQRIHALPERQRAAIVSRELEGRSYEEIARELQASPQMVRGLVHRARTRLRDSFGLLVPLGWLRSWITSGPAPAPDGQRIAELVAGAGVGGGLAKAGAAVLVSGAIATGTGVTVSDNDHGSVARKGSSLERAFTTATQPNAGVRAEAGGGGQRGGPAGRHGERPESESESGTDRGSERKAEDQGEDRREDRGKLDEDRPSGGEGEESESKEAKPREPDDSEPPDSSDRSADGDHGEKGDGGDSSGSEPAEPE